MFSSVAEAARIVGTHGTMITRVCKGKSRIAGGHRWRYATDEEGQNPPMSRDYTKKKQRPQLSPAEAEHQMKKRYEELRRRTDDTYNKIFYNKR